MINRDFLGHVSPSKSILVEAGQLKLFCKAIGETRAVYLDEAAARAAGYRSILAPPAHRASMSDRTTSVDVVLRPCRYSRRRKPHYPGTMTTITVRRQG